MCKQKWNTKNSIWHLVNTMSSVSCIPVLAEGFSYAFCPDFPLLVLFLSQPWLSLCSTSTCWLHLFVSWCTFPPKVLNHKILWVLENDLINHQNLGIYSTLRLSLAKWFIYHPLLSCIGHKTIKRHRLKEHSSTLLCLGNNVYY